MYVCIYPHPGKALIRLAICAYPRTGKATITVLLIHIHVHNNQTCTFVISVTCSVVESRAIGYLGEVQGEGTGIMAKGIRRDRSLHAEFQPSSLWSGA